MLELLLFSDWLAARLFSNYVVRWHTCEAGKSRVCQHFRPLAEERGTKITPCHFLGGRLSSHQNNPLEKRNVCCPLSARKVRRAQLLVTLSTFSHVLKHALNNGCSPFWADNPVCSWKTGWTFSGVHSVPIERNTKQFGILVFLDDLDVMKQRWHD